MDENRTLERLEYFRRLVSNLEYADLHEKLHNLKLIKRGVAEAGEEKLISQRMLQDYDDAFRNNGLLTNNIVDELHNVAVRHLSQFDEAYEQMTKSLEFDKDAVQNSEKDSKEVLEQIKDAMDKYADAYSEKEGALSAVVEFSNIGNIIKDALKEGKLSKTTAVLLHEPLQHMKENMFDSGKQKEEYDNFQNIVQERLNKLDEKEETKDGQSKGGILETAGNVLNKAANAVVNDVKNAFRKDERAKDVADEHTEERKLSEDKIKKFGKIKDDILKRYKRAKKYAEVFSRDEDYHTSGPAYVATAEALEPLAKIVENLDLSKSYDKEELQKFEQQFQETMNALPELQGKLKSVNMAFDDVFENLDELSSSTNEFCSELGLVQKQTANIRDKESKVSIKEDGKTVVQEPKTTEQKVSAPETPHKPDLERKEEAKDVSQRPEDLMQREDKVQEGKQENPKGQEEALLRLKSAINKYRAVKADKSASYADLRDAREAYNDAIKNPLLHDFTVRFYTTDARMADVDYNQSKLLEWIDRELGNGYKQEKQGQRENTSPEIVHDNVTKEAKTEFQTKEKALENLRQLWENLHETRDKWSEHPRLAGLQESNKLFNDFHQALRNPDLKDVADEYYKISRSPFENGLPNYEAVMDAINKGFGRAEQPQQSRMPNDMARGADLSKKQENKDISPKPENLMQREDMTNDKVNAGEKKTEDYEDLIYGLEDVLSHHKDRDPESFKRMMFALKDLSQQGLLPEEMKKEYMDVFNRVKELSNPRDGATQLDSKIIEHLDALEAKQQQAQNQNIPVPNAQYNPNLEKDFSLKPKNLVSHEELGADDIRLNKTVREQAQSNSSIEQRSLDRSGKDAPYDSKQEEPKLSREERIANYVQGKGKVEKMFADKEPQHKTLDQQALATYRRKILLGRGAG